MSIEKEILEFISKGGNELSTREIEAVLTDYNYHSEVEVLDQILEHMVNVGFLTADFDRAEGTMYEITERGIGS